MPKQNLSVTALIEELAKLSAVAVLTATTTLSVAGYNLQNSSEIAVETVELIESETVAVELDVMPVALDLLKDQPALDNLSIAPVQSLRPQARPAFVAKVSGAAVAKVEMVNHNAIRNLSIKEGLKESISSAVGAVYGPGFTAQVYSGGQHDPETAARLGVGRVGTNAHDHGHAADIHVIDPRGRRVTGNALAPLAQYWLATGKGGVGLEMKGAGIHLDQGRVRFWDYASDGGSITKVQLAALIDGKRGVIPKLHTGAESANAAVLEQASPEPMQREASANVPKSGSIALDVTKPIDGAGKISGTASLQKDNQSFSFGGSHDTDGNTEFSIGIKLLY